MKLFVVIVLIKYKDYRLRDGKHRNLDSWSNRRWAIITNSRVTRVCNSLRFVGLHHNKVIIDHSTIEDDGHMQKTQLIRNTPQSWTNWEQRCAPTGQKLNTHIKHVWRCTWTKSVQIQWDSKWRIYPDNINTRNGSGNWSLKHAKESPARKSLQATHQTESCREAHELQVRQGCEIFPAHDGMCGTQWLRGYDVKQIANLWAKCRGRTLIVVGQWDNLTTRVSDLGTFSLVIFFIKKIRPRRCELLYHLECRKSKEFIWIAWEINPRPCIFITINMITVMTL